MRTKARAKSKGGTQTKTPDLARGFSSSLLADYFYSFVLFFAMTRAVVTTARHTGTAKAIVAMP